MEKSGAVMGIGANLVDVDDDDDNDLYNLVYNRRTLHLIPGLIDQFSIKSSPCA